MRYLYTLLVRLLALVSLTATLTAQDKNAPTLTADEPIEFDQETNSMTAKGNAELKTPGYNVTADQIRFQQQDATQQAYADGDVALNIGKMRVLSREATYNLTDNAIEADLFRLGRYPVFVSGEEMTYQDDQVTVSDGTLFYSEPGFATPNVSADSFTYNRNGTLTLSDPILHIGNTPILRLPVYQFDTDTSENLFVLQTSAGYQDDLGGYVKTKLLVRPDPRLELGPMLDFYSERGFLYGPYVNYRIKKPDETIYGDIYGGYINDYGSRGQDILNRPIDNNRYFIEWHHKQHIHDSIDVIGRATLWSDSAVERDFRPDDFEPNQQPDNFFETTYRADYSLYSFFMRGAPNDFYTTQQRLPEVRADLIPIKLGETGLYQHGFASYANLIEKSPNGLPERESDRIDAYYGLQYPWKPNQWFAFKPVAGVRATHYADAINDRSSYTRILGQVGFDAQVDAYGFWDVQNDFWGLQGLRHKVRPVLSYRFIPEAQTGSNSIPSIDRNFLNTYLEPLDLAIRRDVDDLYETNTFRYGLENSLQTKHEEYGARDLLYLNLYQDFRFQRRPGEDDFSDLHTVAGISPVYWLDVSLYSRTDIDDGRLRELRTRWVITDGDRWEAALTTDNLEGRFDQYYADLRYRVNHRHSILTSARFNAYRDEFTMARIGMESMVGNSWRFQYGIEWTRGDQREDDLGFNIQVDLIKF